MELQISQYCETKWDKESSEKTVVSCFELRCRWHDHRYWYHLASQYPVLSGLWIKLWGPSCHFMINFGACKWNRNQTIHLSWRTDVVLHPHTRKVVCSSHRPNAVVGQSSEHCYQKWTSPKSDVGFRTPRCPRPVTALWGDRNPSNLKF